MRERKWVAVLVLVVLLALMCSAALAESYTAVTNARVNMRRSASSSSVVLETLDKNETVVVTGVSGNYYAVTARGRNGFVLKTYITGTGSAAAAEESAAGPVLDTASGYPYETTVNDKVNLRAKASVNSSIVATVPKGTKVSVLSVGESFVKVSYNGKECYCVMDYVNLKEIVEPLPTAVPVNASNEIIVVSETYETLQQGSSGSAVRALQSALVELGYLTGKPDGVYGASTLSAVKALQTMNKYPSTGIVDANLQAFIYNGKPLNSKGQAATVKTLAPIDDVTIHLGEMGELVGRVQIRLTELGFYTGEVTGTYDAKTRDAAKAFQKKNGIKADGLVGKTTRLALFSGTALTASSTPSPKPTATPKPTPKPTPEPTYKAPGAKVQYGSTGENAKLVQQRMKDLGYYTGRVDGRFFDSSVTALKAFQKAHGLKADGVAGDSTYALMFSANALAVGTTATPLPTAVVVTPEPVVTIVPATSAPTYAPVTRENVVVIKKGVTGTAVTRLQERLTELGYYKANVDGKCKTDDVNAIKAFQKKNKLTVDGAAGYETQVLLYSVSAVTNSGAVAGGSVDSFTTLRKGSSGTAVKQLQERLIALGYLSGSADGIYGSNTVNAVIEFQRANDLKRDGVAGSGTQAMIYSAAAIAATPKPVSTPADAQATGTLKKGDSSEAVKAMQQQLISLGYLTGKADGVFGAKTYQAVVAFQKASGLKADGIAGLKTLNKITASGTSQQPAATATPVPSAPSTTGGVRASQVKYENWYTTVKAKCRNYPYATIYDFSTGISWQVHMFSLGAHADSEPLTATDTANMERAFGGNTWEPKAVWVILGDGTVYMASTHSMPHEVQHNTGNNFDGHLCIHFPRTAAQVAAIGPYATRHQAMIDAGWKLTQAMQ